MYKRIIFIIALVISILSFNNELSAQSTEPTYQSMMELGDKEYNNQEYIKAKAYYQEALRIKTNDATAKAKLDRTLQKIREQSEKEEVFFQYLDEADSFYNNSDYEKALTAYNEAIKIFPQDNYTKNQIETITKIINDERERINNFNEMVSIADNFMSQEKYAEATLQYKSALELYPNNIEVQSKYKEAKAKKEELDMQTAIFEQLKREAQEFTLRKKYAEAIEKYQRALEIFPDETELNLLITELTNKKNITEQYNSKIHIADSLYLEKSYNEAIVAYNEALNIIPDDAYSTDMIARINETLKSEEYLAMQNYLAIIEEAKSYENANNWDSAISKYQEALTLKPGDEFSIQKIEHINKLINQKKQEEELNLQFASLVNDGDNAYNNEDYRKALDSYNRAKLLMPDNLTITEKINNTQKRIDEIEVQLALEKQEIEKQYQSAMVSAEVNLNEENYDDAIKDYERALTIKPNDAAASLGLDKAQKLKESRIAAISTEYKRLVSSGDIEYSAKNYDKAIEYYTQASELESGETYPLEMLAQISEMLKVNKIETLIDKKTKITSNTSKRVTFNPIEVTARRGNYITIKAKNISYTSFNVFISYGSENGKSGSLMIRVPNNQKTNDYIIRIGAQYKWFSEDNTWIEITPENGNIEIESMEITKGD